MLFLSYRAILCSLRYIYFQPHIVLVALTNNRCHMRTYSSDEIKEITERIYKYYRLNNQTVTKVRTIHNLVKNDPNKKWSGKELLSILECMITQSQILHVILQNAEDRFVEMTPTLAGKRIAADDFLQNIPSAD